jgi:hypothetical protein
VGDAGREGSRDGGDDGEVTDRDRRDFRRPLFDRFFGERKPREISNLDDRIFHATVLTTVLGSGPLTIHR